MQVKGLREIVLIHDLKKQGLSITAIARKVGCDRKTNLFFQLVNARYEKGAMILTSNRGFAE